MSHGFLLGLGERMVQLRTDIDIAPIFPDDFLRYHGHNLHIAANTRL
jgi:hypothetical protein